jgi:hypothetical protein
LPAQLQLVVTDGRHSQTFGRIGQRADADLWFADFHDGAIPFAVEQEEATHLRDGGKERQQLRRLPIEPKAEGADGRVGN